MGTRTEIHTAIVRKPSRKLCHCVAYERICPLMGEKVIIHTHPLNSVNNTICTLILLNRIEQGLTSPPIQYRSSGRQFYRSKDPTAEQECKFTCAAWRIDYDIIH